MRVFRDLNHQQISASAIAAIGNFDGVHRGHQALVDGCKRLAKPGDEIAVVTFEPMPMAWFNPAGAPPRLYTPVQRLRELEKIGVDLAWMMRFNAELASLSPRDFVVEKLVRELGVKGVVVGADFRFGKGRAGNIEVLRELATEYGFEVLIADTVSIDGERVSSTRIRTLLADGYIAQAEKLLGRPYVLAGRVLQGKKLGRELGYPTANIRPPSDPCVLGGIFAVRSRWDEGSWVDGVASIGTRPAVDGDGCLLEVHLFDFKGDLYGKRLETRFVKKLRDELDFADLEQLTVQMKIDEANARTALATATW